VRAVLTYHSIDDSRSPISISAEVFAQHVRWLVQRKVRVVPLADVVGADPSNDAVAITFDDGFANIRDAVAQLRDHGLPATVFVVTRHVGTTNEWGGRSESGIPTLPLLGWDELGAMAGQGVAIGAHSRTHPRLPALSTSAVEHEIDGCLEDLHARLRIAPAEFAYPYGAVNRRIAMLASKRFAAAFTAHFAPLSRAQPRAWLPRLDMYYFQRPGSLESWGTARFTARIWTIRARRRVREALI
jgi:peptidoglycan/xylan/chitin deacetylase (PgdA/CDA1 family)